MKKKFIIVLILVLVFILVGCTNVEPLESTSMLTSGEKLEGSLTICSILPSEICWLNYYAEKFVDENPGVKIIHQGPENMMGLESYMDKMLVDLYSGNGGDIYNAYILPVQKIKQSDMFVDLNALINCDTEFAIEEYYEKVINAYRTDDKLFIMPASFNYTEVQMNLAAVELSETNLSETVNFDQMYTIYENAINKGAIKQDAVFCAEMTSYLLDRIEMNSYISFDQLTCSLADSQFVDYLHRSTSVLPSDSTKLMERKKSTYRFNDNLFSGIESFDLSSIQTRDSITDNRTKTMILVTNSDDYVFSSTEEMALSASCQNKKLAWEFIKFVIQEKEYVSGDIYDTESDAYYSKQRPSMGTTIPINRRNYQSELELFSPDHREGVDQALKYASLVDTLAFRDANFDNATKSIFNSLYIGQISPEECAKQLQDRVEIYMYE